jgi:cellulose 1,4-beta-cellobiosidase
MTSVRHLRNYWLLAIIIIAALLASLLPIARTQAAASVKAQYRAADTNATDNQIKPHLNLVNTGTTAVTLSTLKARYYYSKEGTASEQYWCDYAAKGCGNITATFAAGYLEIGFTSGAGSLSAGQSTGEIQNRFAKTDWSNYNETGDYSFDPTKTAFADWSRVTVYENGVLIWGTPAGSTPQPTNTTGSTNPTATRTRTATTGGTNPTATRTATTGGTNPTATRTRTATTGGTNPTATRTNTTGPTPTNPPAGTHLDNPFVGANIYRNVDYVASVNAAATAAGGTLGTKMRAAGSYPTFVWLDSIDAVNGTNGYPRSLAGHLDQALAQGRNAIEIVIYDLPNRDCSALASNGELLIAQNGFNRYKTEYIDPIYNTISQAKYAGLRIIAVIEPDSLPNLITNLSFPKCQEANGAGGYREATTYTLNKLAALSNFYAYIDIAHHGWLGWDSNFNPAITLIAGVIKGTSKGVNSISGFISNTANTTVVQELYMTANQSIGGQPVRSAKYHDWNTYIDELSYGTAWRNAMIAQGFPSSVGMVIDTSRNGWGGAQRPTGPSTSTDLNTFVNASRIDRRIHKGNWCNQSNAGIGERPVANPAPGFDAYVWVKPPGESDGSSTLVPTGPENPGGKGFDRMCDPTYTGNSLNGQSMTGALPNAPVSGRWFGFQFQQLVENAYPPL